jgi:hypothetical protein
MIRIAPIAPTGWICFALLMVLLVSSGCQAVADNDKIEMTPLPFTETAISDSMAPTPTAMGEPASVSLSPAATAELVSMSEPSTAAAQSN